MRLTRIRKQLKMLKTYSTKLKSPNGLSAPKHYLTWAQRKVLQSNLQENLPDLYRQRIEIMLLADEGKSQTEICRMLNCSQPTARYWANVAESGRVNKWKESPLGRPKAVNQDYLDLLKKLLDHNPQDYGYSFKRWTLEWLIDYLAKDLGIQISARHLRTILKENGLSLNKGVSIAKKNYKRS